MLSAPREERITLAYQFLSDPRTRGIPIEKKIQYLESKDHSRDELEAAIARMDAEGNGLDDERTPLRGGGGGKGKGGPGVVTYPRSRISGAYICLSIVLLACVFGVFMLVDNHIFDNSSSSATETDEEEYVTPSVAPSVAPSAQPSAGATAKPTWHPTRAAQTHNPVLPPLRNTAPPQSRRRACTHARSSCVDASAGLPCLIGVCKNANVRPPNISKLSRLRSSSRAALEHFRSVFCRVGRADWSELGCKNGKSTMAGDVHCVGEGVRARGTAVKNALERRRQLDGVKAGQRRRRPPRKQAEIKWPRRRASRSCVTSGKAAQPRSSEKNAASRAGQTPCARLAVGICYYTLYY